MNYDCFHCGKRGKTPSNRGLFSKLPTGWMICQDRGGIRPDVVCSDDCADLASEQIWLNRRKTCTHQTGYALDRNSTIGHDVYHCNYCRAPGGLVDQDFQADNLLS